MGIVPKQWGPYVWATIHLVCMGAPDVLDAMQQIQYKAFFQSLPFVIPCSSCSTHLIENYKLIPFDDRLTGNKDLFRWSVELHNLVNQQLNTPAMTFDDAYAKWRKVCDSVAIVDSEKNKESKNHFTVITVTVAIATALLFSLVVLLFWIYNNKK